jgi:hypothetical protein
MWIPQARRAAAPLPPTRRAARGGLVRRAVLRRRALRGEVGLPDRLPGGRGAALRPVLPRDHVPQDLCRTGGAAGPSHAGIPAGGRRLQDPAQRALPVLQLLVLAQRRVGEDALHRERAGLRPLPRAPVLPHQLRRGDGVPHERRLPEDAVLPAQPARHPLRRAPDRQPGRHRARVGEGALRRRRAAADALHRTRKPASCACSCRPRWRTTS